MDAHKLTGQLHNESGQVTGQFLKATSPTQFSFQPHGLNAADVGALALHAKADTAGAADTAAQATNADTLDNQHAAAFEPAIAAPADATKVWDGTKSFRYNDRLCASDGAPTAAVIVDAAGKVGISTAAPTEALDVTGNLKTSGSITASAGNLYIGTEGATNRALVLYSHTSGANFTIVNYGNYTDLGTTGDQHLTISSAGSSGYLSIAAGGSTRIRVQSNGRVGIGNTNPTTDLDVTGAVKLNSTLSLPTMSTAGFVKNAATTGLLSGGNAIAAADLPADIGHPTTDTYPIPRFRGSGINDPTTDLRTGDLFYNATSSKLKIYTGAAWTACA